MLSDSMVLYSVMTFAVASYNNMRDTRNTPVSSLYLGLHQKAILSINVTIAQRQHCTSDETIGAVFIMAF